MTNTRWEQEEAAREADNGMECLKEKKKQEETKKSGNEDTSERESGLGR